MNSASPVRTAVRDLVVGVFVDEHADRLRGMAGRLHDLQDDVAEGDPLPVRQRPDLELGLRPAAVADPRPRGRGELQVPGEEVGVEVGVDDTDDAKAVRGRVVQVVLDVPARVDDDRLPGGRVPDQVGGLGEAVDVVLGEHHRGGRAGRAHGRLLRVAGRGRGGIGGQGGCAGGCRWRLGRFSLQVSRLQGRRDAVGSTPARRPAPPPGAGQRPRAARARRWSAPPAGAARR